MFVSDVICLPKSRLFTQGKSLLPSTPLQCAALLRKGQTWVTRGPELYKDVSCCKRGWTTCERGKLDTWVRECQALSFLVILHKQNLDLTLQPRWHQLNFRRLMQCLNWECNNHQLLIQSEKRNRWFQKLQNCSSRPLEMHPCLWGLSDHSPMASTRGVKNETWPLQPTLEAEAVRSCLDLSEALPSRAYLAYWIGRS